MNDTANTAKNDIATAESKAKTNVAAAESDAVTHIEQLAGEYNDIVQSTGDSKTAVMSQNAVTDYGKTIKELTDTGVSIINSQWEIGGINGSGILTNDTFSARTTSYISKLSLADFVYERNENAPSSTNIYLSEYDKDYNFIKRSASYGSEVLKITDENCVFVKLCVANTNVTDPLSLTDKVIACYKSGLSIERVLSEGAFVKTELVPALESVLNGKVLNCEWVNGGIHANGYFTQSNTAVRTEYIDLYDIGKLTFGYIDESVALYMAEYDKDLNFIVRNYATYPTTLSPTSANCAYVALSALKDGVAQEDIPNLVSVRYEDNRRITKTSYAFDGISIKSINHRGFNRIAPENTLPAFRLSKQKGFDFVECDVALTSDGVPVLLHDETINRTARNTDGSEISEAVNINSITYEEALLYDFGVWKDAIYTSTKIPTLDEFIALCKNLGLFAYIELKSTTNYTDGDIENIVAIVKKYGMENSVSYISFNRTMLIKVAKADKCARLGWLQSCATDYQIRRFIYECKTDVNSLFFDCNLSSLTTDVIDACEANKIPIEVYCPNTESAILALDNRVAGVTSDTLVAKDVIYNANIGVTDTGLV
jgi:glycerophosphoryl diester phosphodiesterase